MEPFRPDFHRRRCLLMAGVAAPLLLPGAATRAAAPGALDAALRQRIATDGVGFALARVDPGGLHLHTAGVTRAGGHAPIDAMTLFELGSMTKPFVALLLADGVLKRRHSFDDPVEDALAPPLRLRDSAGQPLRLIDLATHRSGLPRLPSELAVEGLADPYARHDESRLHAFLQAWRPQYRRGERFEYSNLGYGLLALVLARRLGLSLDDALRRDVLEPLELREVRIARPMPAGDDLATISRALAATLATSSRMATGHDGTRRPAPAWHFDALAGALGLVGTITDVGRFAQAALGLHETALAEAFALCLRHRVEGSHALHPFGLAWEMSTIVARDSTRELFNQDGATAGFSTSLWLEPARRRGAAVLANAFVETRSLALQALDPTLDESAFNRMLLPPEALAALIGRYERVDRAHAVDVRLRNARLWLHGAGRQPVELLPRAARRFFLRDAPYEIEFDTASAPQQLLVHNERQALLYRRQP